MKLYKQFLPSPKGNGFPREIFMTEFNDISSQVNKIVSEQMRQGNNNIVMTLLSTKYGIREVILAHNLRVGSNPKLPDYSYRRNVKMYEDDLLIEIDPTHELVLRELAFQTWQKVIPLKNRIDKNREIDWGTSNLKEFFGRGNSMTFVYDDFKIRIEMRKGVIRPKSPEDLRFTLSTLLNKAYIDNVLSFIDPATKDVMIAFDLYKMGTPNDKQLAELKFVCFSLFNYGRDIALTYSGAVIPYIRYEREKDKSYIGLLSGERVRIISKFDLREYKDGELYEQAHDLIKEWAQEHSKIGEIEHFIVFGSDIGSTDVFY